MLGVIVWIASVGLRCPHHAQLECAGHGACMPDGTCSCVAGFGGFDCAVVLACDPHETRLPCRGRGSCDVDLNRCRCAPGYSGATCEVDDWCPKDGLGRKCSNAGICAAHNCECFSHRSGVACEYGDTSARAVPVLEDQTGRS